MSYLGRWPSSVSSHLVSASLGNNYYQLTDFTVFCLTGGGLGKSEVVSGPRLRADVWLWLGCSVVMFTHASEILTTRNRIFNVKLIIKTSAMRDG